MSIEIVAEIGVNHNGQLTTACELARMAKACGCDTVKTQLFNAERSYGDRGKVEDIKRLELSVREVDHLRRVCVSQGVGFLCTPDDVTDADLLHAIGVERFKIGSSNVTNLKLIRQAASYGLPLLLSTGASTWQEICAAWAALRVLPHSKVTLMHCVSAYPAPLFQMNLNMLRVYRRQFRCSLGLSDHTVGWEAAVMSVALGVSVIERHFTLDNTQDGPDHAMSLDPHSMRDFVRSVREAERALGDGDKYVLPCEEQNRVEYLKFVARQMRGNNVDSPTIP